MPHGETDLSLRAAESATLLMASPDEERAEARQLPDITEPPTIALQPRRMPPAAMLSAAQDFADAMASRRSVRDFTAEPLPEGLIEAAVSAAASAPSGANIQPWRFVVMTDPERKRRLRLAAEAEERDFYARRATQEWLDAIAPIGTDWRKPFLETAPAVIVVFEVHQGPNSPKPYYAKESVGMAVGLLLAALHQAGVATLTHTPSPMRFLNEVCERPAEERPFVVIPVGYAAPDARVPDIQRKPLAEVMVRC
jgi:iodotyrosine deiodinase